MLTAFLDDIRERDVIAPRLLAARLRLPVARLARLAHLNRNAMTARPESPAVQAKLGEIARIVSRAADLAGDEGRAVIWFKFQTMPGFGKTAEEMVEDGRGALVLEDLERQASGVYS